MQLRGPIAGGVWCREMITDEHGARWHVDAWVAPRSGRLVLGELRLLPAVGGQPGTPWPLDPERVPRRGLERRTLGRVPVGRFVPQVLAGLGEAEALHASGYKGPAPGALMVSSFLLAALPGVRALVRRPRPRRNVGRDDDFYARLAAQYVGRIKAGSITPVKDIAEQRDATAAHIRDLLHEARERGLLTKGATGKSEGALTPRALALLSGKEAGKAARRRPR
jgi:hypothetical protein